MRPIVLNSWLDFCNVRCTTILMLVSKRRVTTRSNWFPIHNDDDQIREELTSRNRVDSNPLRKPCMQAITTTISTRCTSNPRFFFQFLSPLQVYLFIRLLTSSATSSHTLPLSSSSLFKKAICTELFLRKKKNPHIFFTSRFQLFSVNCHLLLRPSCAISPSPTAVMEE